MHSHPLHDAPPPQPVAPDVTPHHPDAASRQSDPPVGTGRVPQSAGRSARRVAAIVLLWLLSLLVVAVALYGYSTTPLGSLVTPAMSEVFRANRGMIYLHIYGSAIALLLGPLQFSTRVRRRFPRAHRIAGRLYLFGGVLLGGIGGLGMALHTANGAVAQLSFILLSLCWLATGALALRAILRRDVHSHEAWMIRNFALTFGAVTLRVYMGVAQELLAIPFEVAYPPVTWAAWVVNLIVAERIVRTRPRADRSTIPRRAKFGSETRPGSDHRRR